jgi:hypothetical protein
MACEVLIILIFLLHIYMGTNIITDLDWLYYINSEFIIILETLLLNIDVDWGNVWQWWMLMIMDWK